MNTLESLASWLQLHGLGVYDDAGAAELADWSVFLEAMPPAPDLAIGLFQYAGGGDPDSRNPWEDLRVQVRVRGSANPSVSRARAEAIYAALHGLGPVELPGQLWLQLATAVNSGVAGIGLDSNGRHEHVANFNLSISR